MKPIAVIGAGAFGTALAVALSGRERAVFLWAREGAAAMAEARENAARLPGVTLPRAVRPIGDVREIPSDAVQILALPAQATRGYLAEAGGDLPRAPLVLAAKGIDLETGALQSEIAAEVLPGRPLAVLSGPGFAGEIARGLPTALTLAAGDKVLGAQIQERLSAPTLRLYRSTDLIGVQLGGALKNVVAIACGMCDGAGLGESARAALMTRGFAEMMRLGRAMGAEVETFTGLSGFGDLALTAASPASRNFAHGRALGAETPLAEGVTVEGVATARAVLRLAAERAVDMPIASAVVAVLDGKMRVGDAVSHLLNRPLRAEGI